MAQGERAPDGQTYWGLRPDELAAIAAGHAAEQGIHLDLRPDTPVVVAPMFEDRGIASGTWGEIDTLHRAWAAIGCAWVNLGFALEDNRAIVRVEANPTGYALPYGGLPACNGGGFVIRTRRPDHWARE